MNSDNALRGAADAARDLSAGDLGLGLGKASPAIAMAGATIAGVTLQDWVCVASLIFIGLQAAHLVWKWRRDLKRAAQEDGGE